MKKTIAHIIVCLLVVIVQLLFEVVPLTRYPLKLKICETSIEKLMKHEKLMGYTKKMNQVEKDQLVAFKKEICNQR